MVMNVRQFLSAQLILMILVPAVLLIFIQPNCFGKDGIVSNIIFTTDPTARSDQKKFSAFDTVYALIILSRLTPGPYKVTVNWINPAGALDQSSSFSFSIATQSTYTFNSWLHLMRNGPLKRTFGGKIFDDQYIGRWKLRLFVNNILLSSKTFVLF